MHCARRFYCLSARGLTAVVWALLVGLIGVGAVTAFGQATSTEPKPAADAKSAERPAIKSSDATSKPATTPKSRLERKPTTDTAPTTSAKAAPAPAAADGKLTFSFRYQPWQQVLDWFAEQAGLSLLMDSPPPGTFNYSDTRSYTPAEALDVLNGVLLTKGYTLVRHGRMLVVVNLEDGIPPNLVPDVPLAELDQRGEYELIRVLFPVWNMTPEQAAAEVQPLLGPQGKVITLPQAREIQVTETAGRLRTIRSIVNAVEQPDGKAGMREFPLTYITFDAAMPTIRTMLGISTDAFNTPDGTAQITKSATGEKILFRGTAQQSTRLSEILRLIDVPEAARGVNGAPQLDVYSVPTTDPEAVVKVLQTMLRDPSAVLTADKEGGHIYAFATPPQQATIRATIDQMQKEARQVDVIGLTNVDPQTAVVAINKLFGSSDEKPDPKAPRVDADITTRSLLVRGTAGQVAQIKELLRKLGETEDEGGAAATRSKQHVRLLPLSGAAARSAITQIEQIWPSVRTNSIRIVTPSSAIPSYRPADSSGNATGQQPGAPASPPPSVGGADDQIQQMWQSFLKEQSVPAAKPAPKSVPDGTKVKKDSDASAQNETASIFRLVGTDPRPAPAQNSSPVTPPKTARPAADTAPKTATAAPTTSTPSKPALGRSGAPVVVAPGPGGTLIASDDLEALDQLEDMLSTVAGHNAASGREYAVFYLKYSKAPVIAEVLAAIFGGTTGGKDKGLIGDIANNALGQVGGGLMGDLLLGGSASGSFSSATVDIIPDSRLNALIVHAKQTDIDTIQQLLQVLDQRNGPESIEADPPPRAIPVYNTTAADMAQIVQGLYQDRMSGASAVMSPQEMMKMIRGGNNAEQQVQKMSIAVDTRNNMLIVRAPDPLFDDIKELVAHLDQANGDSPQTTKVVTLQHTNSSAVQRALTSLLSNVKTSTTPVQGAGQTPTAAQTSSQGNDEDSPEERMRRAMRRNWEMIQEMQKMRERSGGESGGDRGGFDRSRYFGRGGSDRGGFDRGRGSDGDRGRGGDGERGRRD
jgi:type II secretory pathway component GspD/PulD (secretin)